MTTSGAWCSQVKYRTVWSFWCDHSHSKAYCLKQIAVWMLEVLRPVRLFLEHICWLLCKNVYAFLSSKFYHKSKKIKKETLTSVKLACYMIFGGKPLNVTLFSACFLNVLNKSRCMFFSSCACILIRTLYIVQLRLSDFNIQEWSVIVIGQKYGTAARAHNKSSHIDSL